MAGKHSRPEISQSAEMQLPSPGETYEKGVGTNSESEITVYLGGKNYRFTAAAGIDDEAIDDYNKTGAAYQPPQVTFELWADGVKVYDSGLVNMERPKVNIDVLIKIAGELLLKVTDGGNTNSYDHGDWADAKFVNVGEVAPGDITNIALEAAASSPAQTAANSGPEMANNDDVDVTKNGFAILEGQEESVRYLQYDWTELRISRVWNLILPMVHSEVQQNVRS